VLGLIEWTVHQGLESVESGAESLRKYFNLVGTFFIHRVEGFFNARKMWILQRPVFCAERPLHCSNRVLFFFIELENYLFEGIFFLIIILLLVLGRLVDAV
jgi:hypothetical protein